MGAGVRFEATPSWRLAIILGSMVMLSYAVETVLHKVEHFTGHKFPDDHPKHKSIEYRHMKHMGVQAAVRKLKDELMLLGFVTMLLLFTQDAISYICMPDSWHEPKTDPFNAAVHSHDSDCLSSMFVKTSSAYASADTAHRRLWEVDSAASVTAKKAVQYAIDTNAPPQVLAYLQEAMYTASANADYALALPDARRQLGGAAGAGSSPTCLASGKEEFASLAALHQAHILIFLIAFFHITYSIITMALVQRNVENLDHLEFYGDDDSESVAKLTAPHKGWLCAFKRQLTNGFRNPFTYMSLRNFFIIKHRSQGLNADFPFDDFISLRATREFQNLVGMKWWMWFVLAVQVLLDGLDMQQVMFGLSCFSVILSMLVGTKVSKVASDIARKSYRLYDRDGDGRISAEELEAMQSEVGSTDRSQLNVVNSGMGDQNFWCGKPELLTFLMQYIMFQNSMVFSFLLFNAWQVKGICYLPYYERYIRVVLGLGILIHDALITYPTYIVVMEMGNDYHKDLLRSVLQFVEAGDIKKSRVTKSDSGSELLDQKDVVSEKPKPVATDSRPRPETPPSARRRTASSPPRSTAPRPVVKKERPSTPPKRNDKEAVAPARGVTLEPVEDDAATKGAEPASTTPVVAPTDVKTPTTTPPAKNRPGDDDEDESSDDEPPPMETVYQKPALDFQAVVNNP